ncbi:MAG: hypothetical protein A2Y67_04095 [Candidatus Buchananbacteria bacterium RBG_13_39_9]|uniref:Uncharacterized protein n=1 Tax=Candidatus Buchananbacteria bacterium RBG_13_39_9 TaxID=1797531 RepID=A0A1G1XNW4_9BACT|nr:MAG: hypothetical protein A2Y67_04095 [Candidatus Buchananbacteria bacterium RBG_13_39_9]
MARIITEIWDRISDNCFCLKSSMEDVSLHRERLMANGVVHFRQRNDEIAADIYATFNSPIHNLTASPGETIYLDMFFWTRCGESNGFELISRSTRLAPEQGLILVETEYEIPDDYTGPYYKKRKIYFDVKTLQIKKVEMEYQDGKKDIGEFESMPDGGFKIKWVCEYGPNERNISFA